MKKILRLSDLRKDKISLASKKLVIFDLDGTLTKSKQVMESGMARLLNQLLQKNKVAVISGDKYEIFKKQFLGKIKNSHDLYKNLFLFPTSAAAFYRYNHGWQNVYRRDIPKAQRKEIKSGILKALLKARFAMPARLYGPQIEDRGSEIAFSALGQQAPLKLKQKWNRECDSRPKIMKYLRGYLPNLEIREGGLTSIDINMKGIDKAYGVRQISKVLNIPKNRILFVGDALYPGGNDYAAVKTGVTCLRVNDPEETKKLIKALIC